MIALVVLITLAVFVIFQFTEQTAALDQHTSVDWRLIPAGLLILFALWILAAVALACSTRLDMIATLAVCSAVFLVGLMSDYFFGLLAAKGAWWASALYSLVPNWQLFWLADALETGKNTFQWAYVGKALGYAVCYAVAALAVGVALFDERELS